MQWRGIALVETTIIISTMNNHAQAPTALMLPTTCTAVRHWWRCACIDTFRALLPFIESSLFSTKCALDSSRYHCNLSWETTYHPCRRWKCWIYTNMANMKWDLTTGLCDRYRLIEISGQTKLKVHSAKISQDNTLPKDIAHIEEYMHLNIPWLLCTRKYWHHKIALCYLRSWCVPLVQISTGEHMIILSVVLCCSKPNWQLSILSNWLEVFELSRAVGPKKKRLKMRIWKTFDHESMGFPKDTHVHFAVIDVLVGSWKHGCAILFVSCTMSRHILESNDDGRGSVVEVQWPNICVEWTRNRHKWCTITSKWWNGMLRTLY